MGIFGSFNDVEARMGGFQLLPNGEYEGVFTAASVKVSKAGHEYLQLEFTVQKGEHRGVTLRQNYNLNHPNEQPRNIARSEFKYTCECLGLDANEVNDTSELLNRPIVAEVIVEPFIGKDDLEHQANRIKKFAKVARAVAPKPAGAPGKKDPWS